MSEGIIIALITVAGTVLGGIISQLIARSATIQAAKMKDGGNQTLSNKDEKPRSRGMIIGGALGAIGTLVILSLLGMLPPRTETSPTPITTIDSPVSAQATNSDPSILVSEDFEDGKAQMVTYVTGNWQIITDETGNKVYDIDNSTSSSFPGIDFGLENWEDYEISFRTRFLEGKRGWAIVYFRTAPPNYGGYVASISLEDTSLEATTRIGEPWKPIIRREYNLENNIWYWVRVEAKGSEIKISINDSVVINTDAFLHDAGSITIQAGEYTHAQFDDVQVKSLGH